MSNRSLWPPSVWAARCRSMASLQLEMLTEKKEISQWKSACPRPAAMIHHVHAARSLRHCSSSVPVMWHDRYSLGPKGHLHTKTQSWTLTDAHTECAGDGGDIWNQTKADVKEFLKRHFREHNTSIHTHNHVHTQILHIRYWSESSSADMMISSSLTTKHHIS